jgi:hypothetical protein
VKVVGISISQQSIFALIWILLVSTILLVPNCTSDENLANEINEFGTLEEDNISEFQEGPIMRYYLRRYSYPFGQGLPNFNLTIFVQDHDGVDTVIMMYSQKNGDFENISMSTQDTGVWQNASMDHKIDNWYTTTIPISNLSEPYSWCSFLVRYTANDTLGNWEVSPLCIYVLQNYPVTVDWFGIELYDTPDLWYVAGTINHTVTWDVTPDSTGQSGWPYSLYEDGSLTERWEWSGSITIDVDGLDIGIHIFELYIQVAWSTNSKDTVTVHVVETSEEIPPGVSTGSVGPLTEVADATLDPSIPVLAVGLSSIAVIIIWKKRRTRSS